MFMFRVAEKLFLLGFFVKFSTTFAALLKASAGNQKLLEGPALIAPKGLKNMKGLNKDSV